MTCHYCENNHIEHANEPDCHLCGRQNLTKITDSVNTVAWAYLCEVVGRDFPHTEPGIMALAEFIKQHD